MVCRRCKKDIPDESKFCLHCGAKQEVTRSRRQRGNGMGSVYKEGNTYTAAVTLGWDAKNKRPVRAKQRGFKTKKEADAYLSTLRTQPKKTTVHSNITFSQLYDRWLPRHEQRVGKSTIGCYKSAYNHYSDIYHIRFIDLNTEDFQLCIDDCKAGKRTRQNMKALGTLLYGYANELALTDKNYAQHIYIGRMDTESRNAFPREILDKILKAAEQGEPYAAHVAVLCYTGFRPTELLDLQVERYNKAERYFVGGIKTEAGKNRVVPVSPKIQAIVDIQLAGANPYLFASTDGKHLNEKTFREDYFYPLLAKLEIQPIPDRKNGVIPTYTPYSCRHTFATLMKSVPGADKDKSSLMGHTSYEMTMKYQHEDISTLRSIIDQL